MEKTPSYYEAARYLRGVIGDVRPEVLIVCGSGLSHLSKSLSNPITVDYGDIPGFSLATVAGHHGEVVFGQLGGVECVCLRGRFHYYEGNDMNQVVFPIRVMRLLGAKLMVATNASGGLNESFSVGDIVCIQDHYGGPTLVGNTPLRGMNDSYLGPRFFPVSDAFDDELQNIVLTAAEELNLSQSVRPNGTYCFTGGPAYESMAESRFLRNGIGGDCVGMSTIPEVIAARHMGMRILCLSLITNMVVMKREKNTLHASHEEVIEAASTAGKNMQMLVEKVVNSDSLKGYLKVQPEAPELPEQKKSPGLVMFLGFSAMAMASVILSR